MGFAEDLIYAHHAELEEVLRKTLDLHIGTISRISEMIVKNFKEGRKILIFGNGGSYADAFHFAGELEGAYRNRKRAPLPVLVPGNSASLTAIANDFGYDETFLRFVKAHAKSGDLVIGISTSGNSNNVILGLEEAKKIGAISIGFTGSSGGKMKACCDILLNVPSEDTPRIQEAYHFAYHEICDIVEHSLFSQQGL